MCCHARAHVFTLDIMQPQELTQQGDIKQFTQVAEHMYCEAGSCE